VLLGVRAETSTCDAVHTLEAAALQVGCLGRSAAEGQSVSLPVFAMSLYTNERPCDRVPSALYTTRTSLMRTAITSSCLANLCPDVPECGRARSHTQSGQIRVVADGYVQRSVTARLLYPHRLHEDHDVALGDLLALSDGDLDDRAWMGR
jgi:hypothetical protein